MSDTIEINESEFDGYFLEIQFDGETDSTLLFVADKDFDSLKNLSGQEETTWEDFRDELMELLEHSGHKEDHELSEESTEEIRRAIKNW